MNLVSKLGFAALAAALTAGLTVPAATASDAPVQRKAAYKPTLKASAPTVEATKKLVLSGKVKPAPKVKIVLQKRIGDSKKWSTEAKLKTNKKGAFSYTDKPKNTGVRYYRVVVPKAGKVKAGKSKPVKVTVLAWRSLTNTEFRQSESTAVSYGVSIAGKQYSPAIAPQTGAAQGHADWNLDPSCTTLRVRIGNGDQSEANATGQIVLTDALKGTTLVTKSFGLTQSEVSTLDIRGVFRLSYSWTSFVAGSVEPQTGAQPVLAKPELLCA
jgi:hypothetical protein